MESLVEKNVKTILIVGLLRASGPIDVDYRTKTKLKLRSDNVMVISMA